MGPIKKFWLKQIRALAQAASPVYYAYVGALAVMGFAFLLSFPVLAVFSWCFIGYISWQNPPLTWQLHDWLVATGLLSTSVFAAFISYALFKIRIEPPPGRSLTHKYFPILLERINELCTTYGAPEIHHVKLTTRFQLEIVRTPQNGFPSKFINTLMLGMPVMSCMSPLHLKLLLAREIGHLALSKRSYVRRLPYLQNIWQQYQSHYAHDWRLDSILQRIFFAVYTPVFDNSLYPAHQRETIIRDQQMIRITPARNAAEVIAVFAIKQRYLEQEFWPKLNNMAFTAAKPPFLPYSTMDLIMSKALDKITAQLYYEAEISTPVLLDATVPNLRERLLALSQDDFVVPERKTDNAANHFLGKSFADIQKQLDNVWYLKNKSTWEMRYRRGVEEKKRLKLLREQAAHALLSNDEAREYLLLIEKYVDGTSALPLYSEILKTNSLNAKVCYEVGRLLLFANDKRGIDALHMAMDLSKDMTIECCQHIVNYLAKTGDMKKAQDYRRMILAHQVES